jgi:hypothetical protein
MLLRILFSVYRQYIKAFFIAKNGDYFLAGECLKGRISGAYRLHESDKELRLVGFKVIKRSLLKLFGPKFNLMNKAEGELVLIDEEPTESNQHRIDFIERVTKRKVKLYLAKEELMGYPLSAFERLLILIFICLHGCFIVPICFFSKNRVFYALSVYFAIESALGLLFVKRSGLKTVVFSNIYSQDSNINYLIYAGFGCKIIKNPSEDPLAFDNPILFSDELIICNPYQIEEIKILKNVKVKSIIHGLPEQTSKYEGKYWDTFYPAKKEFVGYYSSGSWLRKQQSRYYFHLNIDCAYQEELLLLDLKKFIEVNPQYQIKIFQHPVEKDSQKNIDLTVNYFKSVLGHVPFVLNDANLHTCLSFEECNTAISLLSGSSLYRLNFGYKSLFYVPDGSFPTFPYANTSLDAINIGKKPNFNTFLKSQLEMDEQTFFENHGLNKYKYKSINSHSGEIETINK